MPGVNGRAVEPSTCMLIAGVNGAVVSSGSLVKYDKLPQVFEYKCIIIISLLIPRGELLSVLLTHPFVYTVVSAGAKI